MQRFLLLFLALVFTYAGGLLAQSCDFKSNIISLGGDSHDPGFGRNDNNDAVATLSNGNFVIGWSTDDGIDGDQAGAYFQVFSENGTAITMPTVPYASINAAGTGDQGVSGPKVVALNDGFVIAWTSEDGPGDTGPAGDEQQDVFVRTYSNAGAAISDPIRISVTGEEDRLAFVQALSTGNFVVITGTDEDESGNKDDYYFQVFNASGTSLSGGLVNISGGAHDAAFQTLDSDQPIVDLGGGNFAIAWDTWDDIDGDDKGAFLRIFGSDGTAVTGIIIPYADINAAGAGDQGSPEPRLLKLANGNFVMAWVSEQGPGDVGPGGDFNDDQDVYFRIYQANGTPVTGSLKANSDNAEDEESLDGLIALEGGNFSMIYKRDEDQAGNTDDYFVRTFSPTGMALGASIELSAGAHVNSFVRTLGNRSYAALSNGNFVLGWSPDRSADGDSTSAYFRVFDASGNPLTAIAAPYADINPGGTGPQSTSGPLIEALPNGFAIVWESADGPTDVGPGNNRDYDTYHRVYDNTGMALCGTKKTNMGSDGEEERPVFVQALANGDFVVMYRDEETNGNKDDFFARVIGGAPAVNVCPTVGEMTIPPVCQGESYTITVTGLENMAQASNGERDYGISFYAYLSADVSTVYSVRPTPLATVPFSELGDGGTTATLVVSDENLIRFTEDNTLIIAILDATPTDDGCRPGLELRREFTAKPFVDMASPGNLCADAGVQTGLGNVTPSGGVFSGPGITDDGNGSTYSLDIAAAGVGMHELTYTFTGAESCTFTETRSFEVFAAPTVTFTAPEDLDADAGVQTGLGGGTPAQGTAFGDQGVYSGPGVTDDGNGMTYSFDPAAAGVGVHTITYMYTDANDCSASASDDVEVKAVAVCPTIGEVTVSSTCAGQPFSITVSGLENMAQTDNGERDYGINIYAFISVDEPTNLYGGSSPIGTVPFSELSSDGTSATLLIDENLLAFVDINPQIYAILDATPADAACRPFSTTTRQPTFAPSVSFTAPEDLDEDAGVQTSLGGGTPAQGTEEGDQGVYSGPGVTDDGNGMTYSFDPAAAGVGVHTITYTYMAANGCSASASDDVEVKEATLVITPIDDINDVDENGVAASIGQEVAVQGIVYCEHFPALNNKPYSFFILEPNGDGILVNGGSEALGYEVVEGDEIIVEGTIGQLRGLLEISPSKITVVSQANALVSPIATDSLTEAIENKYVTLEISDADQENITLSSGSNATILRFPSASQGILTIGVWNSSGISSEFLSNYINTTDVGTFRITGVVYQEDSNLPLFDTYFLVPCSESDFDFLTSTDEPAWANELVVFPNPTTDEVNIRSSVDIEEWRLIDLQGRVLSRGANNSQRFAVDLAEWPSGLYRLQLINGKEAVQRPVIKQ